MWAGEFRPSGKLGSQIKRLLVSGLLALSFTRTASAHRLDEYLQATLIGVTQAGVDVEINLTPGIAVLPAVIAAIDRNRDGQISPGEEQAYAADVIRDVELQLDGKPVSLRLVGSRFPSMQAMSEGLGTIQLNLRADGTGHELRFENHHMPGVSVYLVNCLATRDDGLVVGTMERDAAQKSIRFPYSFGDTRGTVPGTGWLTRRVAFWLAMIALSLIARLALRRSKWKPHD